MKKILFLLIPICAWAQELKYEDGVYSKVFQTEKSNEEVYQNAREWIAINFKSANDVLQLDTKEKLIVKGSMEFSLYTGTSVLPQLGEIMVTVSIREKRFKVDYEMSETRSKEFPNMTGNFKNLAFLTYASMSEEDVLKQKLASFEESARNEGWKEKKISKTKKNIIEANPGKYKNHIYTKKIFESKVTSIINSLDEYVNSEEKKDDW
ncbi:DUF4468 domain-containing protein [Flavobacteriaceae bacterium]|nr:DUF4468 domain-containing protein [Flavobacteriaceae bacterium]